MADKTRVKVCGLTRVEEVKMLADNNVEFAGMVMFFPKSKRNINEDTAKILLKEIKKYNISKSVAVVVSPTVQQLDIIQNLGFDYIQIHKDLSDAVYEKASIPIIRAINVKTQEEKEEYNITDEMKNIYSLNKVAGILFDGSNPGAGKTFDWDIICEIEKNDKLFILAGGLNPDNVKEAVNKVKPDVVDVSSGVEKEEKKDIFLGKDKEKIKKIVENARSNY